jgi:3-hydroxyacyl-CoA dehydrogenase/enoyl-CoA hydratase/3-hydroxybutyryl-CoA epimerase
MNTTKSLIFLNKKANGIALFILDCPSKVNYLTKQVFDEFAIMLKEVIADPNVKALVLLSGKADSFILGADIREILESKSREHAGTLSANGQEILNTLSRTNKPTVVGIHGPCLGGGLELALCTNFRIATDSDTTILGLPETRLGLLPGLGGTQRLPRLIGTKAALDMILNANPISAQEALELGMVDKLVSPDDLVATCEEIALYLVSNEKTATSRSKTSMKTPCLKNTNPIKNSFLF